MLYGLFTGGFFDVIRSNNHNSKYLRVRNLQEKLEKPGGTVLCIQILQKMEKRKESLLPNALCIIIWPLSHDILEIFHPT